MTFNFSNFRVSDITDCKVYDDDSQNTHSYRCPSESPICSYGICKGKHMFVSRIGFFPWLYWYFTKISLIFVFDLIASAAEFEPCPSNYCKNGGTCRVEDAKLPNNAKCECPPAFAGVRCADGKLALNIPRLFSIFNIIILIFSLPNSSAIVIYF